MRTNKMSRGQLATFINQNYNGDQIFDMMINFYQKYDSKIADMLKKEDLRIYEMTGSYYMRQILNNFSSYVLRRPINLFWETINGEHDIYLKRKEANRYIQYYTAMSKNLGCNWPDNNGINDAVDYLNKWFCHYNEI